MFVINLDIKNIAHIFAIHLRLVDNMSLANV